MLGKPSRRTRKRLEEDGVRAPATVVDIAERGWAVTSGPSNMVSSTTAMLKTTLRVEPPGEPAFEVTKRLRYPQLSIPSAGARINVIFDRDDHEELILDHSAPSSLSIDVGGGQPLDLEAILAQSLAGDASVTTHIVGSPPEDRLDQLEQLGRLHAQGVLTEAEFAAEKQRILDAP